MIRPIGGYAIYLPAALIHCHAVQAGLGAADRSGAFEFIEGNQKRRDLADCGPPIRHALIIIDQPVEGALHNDECRCRLPAGERTELIN